MPPMSRAIAVGRWVALLAVGALACRASARGPRAADEALARLPWGSVVARARGGSVTWLMWRGDPSINKYVDEWVAPRVRERFGIELNPVDGQGAAILNQLVVEREAGHGGTADLLWINGETFANLRRENLLYGPWAQRLPNAQYLDSASSIIMRDFEADPAGYESPWGSVQFALIYDTIRTPEPPRSFAELGTWIQAHPGRFTHDQSFTGISFLKQLMYALGGGVARFQGGFNEDTYRESSELVWAWLRKTSPYFWRKGAAYPADVAALERLFANGEIDFAMSMNQNDVVTKVRQGVLPASAKALVLREGTLANAHFVGIPSDAPHKAAAMVVANFLLSPEAQYQKQRPDVWADGTVLAIERLPREWADSFSRLATDSRAVPRDTLRRYAVPEVNPAYHERIAADWRARVRSGGQ
jgi:putative spermidine/putrescine transport system substrate-binding protein